MSQPSQPSPSPAAQASHHPTIINIPQPPSNPDTPNEMPGTPTSTTTSLSTLSTTAIKDGHRGHAHHTGMHRGHHQQSSTTSLEAERADRISRLAGLSNVSAPRSAAHQQQSSSQSQSPALNFPGGTTAAAPPAVYFDANGQPVASTKISTVGSASATSSGDGRTTTLGLEEDRAMDDRDAELEEEEDEDMHSTDTNFRTEVDSASGYEGVASRLRLGGSGGTPSGGQADPMDEDLATRSVGGFEDRMSDDGSASLVGFGEGAGSTVSGPIYHRRPVPGTSSAGAMAFARWQLERSSSGISDGGGSFHGGSASGAAPVTSAGVGATSASARRDTVRGPGGGLVDRDIILGPGPGPDTPVSASAAIERREARLVDGVATDGAGRAGVAAPEEDDVFVDTTTRGPVPVRSGGGAGDAAHPAQHLVQQSQQPQSQQQHASPPAASASTSSTREAVERIVAGLDESESSAAAGGGPAMGSPGVKPGERLGQFYFEKK